MVSMQQKSLIFLISLCQTSAFLSRVHLGRSLIFARNDEPTILAISHILRAEPEAAASSALPRIPLLNGKQVLPFKIIAGGLKAQPSVAAVYAILDSSFKRGEEGWEAVVHVGVTLDLEERLGYLVEKHGAESVVHVRALSFSYPQPTAMQDVASQWREMATNGGAKLDESWMMDDVLNYLHSEEDDDEDYDGDNDFEKYSIGSNSVADSTIVSPFEGQASTKEESPPNSEEVLTFNRENIDKVLDDVRPHLIADGGNVSVERVDEATKNVYLKLEGACGSCASSTVTMQMGIERTLRERFPDLNEVLEIEADPESAPKELTREAVEEEVGRLASAVIAMGGALELLDVDPATGVVKMMYRGPNKVRQGLELAILDLPFANRVEFTTGDE